MDALKFLEEFDRMCNHYVKNYCKGCPRAESPNCGVDEMNKEERAKLISDVVKWSKEHPQRTRLQDFREKYPNAEVYPDGQPVICCARLGYRKYCGRSFDDNHEEFKVCFNCWNMPVKEDE